MLKLAFNSELKGYPPLKERLQTSRDEGGKAMLRSFSLKNFQSFLEETSISLELNKNAPVDDRSAESQTGDRITKVMAVIGANASGKTTLIKSLGFLDWFIKYSFHNRIDADLPIDPHFSGRDQASEFEADFEMDGQVWRYRLQATRERVLLESLHRRLSRTFSYVFIRSWDADTNTYTVKQQQFGMPQREAVKTRPNASMISTAAQFDVDLATRLVNLQVFSNVTGMGRAYMDNNQILLASDFYAQNELYQTQMSNLLRQWDLGLSAVRLVKQEVTDSNGEKKEIHVPYGVHAIHGREHELILMQESSGTQGAFTLLSRILPALNAGGLAIIDELESDLHPHMLTPILNLFFSPKTNPHNAQIIFTTHAIEVMNQLHKAQIVLVEKDSACESDAWRLDDIKGVRVEDNLYAKYMAGAYGAIPQF